jgi:hypothetical protein
LNGGFAGGTAVYSRAQSVFILEHYFSSKTFAVVHEAFYNRELPKKTTIQRPATKLRGTENFGVEEFRQVARYPTLKKH